MIHAKGAIPSAAVAAIGIMAVLPLGLTALRVLGMPGFPELTFPGSGNLALIGAHLNDSLTLDWIPPLDRAGILYILLLPTAALIIALARLTLGIRVLGFRSILIAIGFQEIGVIPSLLLIATIVCTIVAIRPAMRRSRLPLYARVAVILGIVAMTMTAGLIVGASLGSATLFSFAFFPVVILAMLAESIADTVSRSSLGTAAWRTGWTIAVALVIAGISGLDVVRDVALECPELILTQVAIVILLAEFFDLRLLQDVGGSSRDRGGIQGSAPVVIVARNRWNRNAVARFGAQAPASARRRSVQRLLDGLRDAGFEASAVDADAGLIRELRQRVPLDPRTRAPNAVILNLASGVQGAGRACQLPALAAVAGVPTSGPDTLAIARLSDRLGLLCDLAAAGLPVPEAREVRLGSPLPEDLVYPVVVRSRFDPDLGRRRAVNVEEAREIVDSLFEHGAESVVVEAAPRGRDVRACVIGNASTVVLPLVENVARAARRRCPAQLEPPVRKTIEAYASTAFALMRCRDFARIDFSVTMDGQILLVDIEVNDLFASKGTFATAAASLGRGYPDLLAWMVETVVGRAYGASVKWREACGSGAPFERERGGVTEPMTAPAALE